MKKGTAQNLHKKAISGGKQHHGEKFRMPGKRWFETPVHGGGPKVRTRCLVGRSGGENLARLLLKEKKFTSRGKD